MSGEQDFQKEPLLVFSADTHVGPRPEDLRAYCPTDHLDRFDAFGATATDYNDFFELRAFSEEYWNGRRRNQLTTGHFDPYARLRDMDRDGVSAESSSMTASTGSPSPSIT